MNFIYYTVLLFSSLLSCMAYTPSSYVKQIHGFPRLDENLNSQSNDFDYNDTAYLTGLVIFPILLIAITVIILLVLILKMCFGACCYCCGGPPKVLQPHLKDMIIRKKRNYKLSMFGLAILVLVTVFTMIQSNAKLNAGVGDAIDAVDIIADTATDIGSYANTLAEQIDVITDAIDGAVNCSYLDSLGGFVGNYSAQVYDFDDLISPFPNALERVKDDMYEYGVEKKDQFIWPGFGGLAGLAVLFILGLLLSSACTLRIGITISIFLILAVSLVCSILLALLMVLSDICMDPDRIILRETSGQTADTVAYYLTCAGNNPLEEYVDSAQGYADDLQNEVETLIAADGQCPGDTSLENIIDAVGVINATIGDIYYSTSCAPIQKSWNQLIHKGLCGNGFTGMYGMYMSLSVAALLLYILSFVSSIGYQYFHPRVRKFLKAEANVQPEIEMVDEREDDNDDKIIYKEEGIAV